MAMEIANERKSVNLEWNIMKKSGEVLIKTSERKVNRFSGAFWKIPVIDLKIRQW